MSLQSVLKRIDKLGGFLMEAELTELAQVDRLRQVLCRFNNGRFICAAQDVAHFVGIIEHSKEDWLRDVSLPTSDPIYRGDYATNATAEFHKPTNSVRRNLDPQPVPVIQPQFNESDCGGAFDGFTVTSDADPGL